jgi:hypothetical protein
VAEPFDLPMPPNLVCVGDYVIRVTAIDPTTGATVSGVNVTEITMQVDNTGGTDLEPGNPILIGIGTNT